MAKMFYSAEEAAERLGKSEDQLKQLVREGKLREFRDAGKINYKVDDVDAMAAPSASASGEIILEPAEDSGIELAPSASDMLSLEEADPEDTATGTAAGKTAAKKAKEDTVVPSVGVSVFDDEELDEVVDPLAQTAVTDVAGLGLEGAGSGSGILDLTRESDDTSLGADLFEDIYTGEEESGTIEMGEATRAGLDEAIPETAEAGGDDAFPATSAEPATDAVAAPVAVRTTLPVVSDPLSTALTAALVVTLVPMAFAGLAGAAMVRGVVPSVLDAVYTNMPMYAGGALGAAVGATLVNFFLAKRGR